MSDLRALGAVLRGGPLLFVLLVLFRMYHFALCMEPRRGYSRAVGGRFISSSLNEEVRVGEMVW